MLTRVFAHTNHGRKSITSTTHLHHRCGHRAQIMCVCVLSVCALCVLAPLSCSCPPCVVVNTPHEAQDKREQSRRRHASARQWQQEACSTSKKKWVGLGWVGLTFFAFHVP